MVLAMRTIEVFKTISTKVLRPLHDHISKGPFTCRPMGLAMRTIEVFITRSTKVLHPSNLMELAMRTIEVFITISTKVLHPLHDHINKGPSPVQSNRIGHENNRSLHKDRKS